jgi:hypothetical protein
LSRSSPADDDYDDEAPAYFGRMAANVISAALVLLVVVNLFAFGMH